jgi:WD40 repeat protein
MPGATGAIAFRLAGLDSRRVDIAYRYRIIPGLPGMIVGGPAPREVPCSSPAGGRITAARRTNITVNAQEVTEGQEARPNDYQFDVFLSYSRKDEEFARKLEEALENYRLPKDVKTSLVSKNRLSVFRDKRDLVPVAGDYWKTIEGYLARSANLVVVCSPSARLSEYVNHEVRAFLRSHEAKGIIPVLLSGKPNNESEAGPDEYAFPEALCGALSMPLALEFTEFQRARGKVNKGRYHDAWYTLLAKIFGAERAEIERQDAKRQARRRAIFAAVSVAVIAVLSVALVVAVISRQEAVRQRDHTRRLLYASDVNLAQRAFESGNVGLGRGLLEPYLAANQSGQEDLRGFEWYYLWRIYNGQLATFDGTDDIAFSRDGAAFATATADTLKIWDAASLRATASFKLSGPQNAEGHPYTSIALSPDGRTLAYGDGERTMLLDIGSGSSREVPVRGEGARRGTPRFSPDGRLLAVSYGCGLVAVYDVPSLKQIVRLGDGLSASYCADFVAFSPDGRVLAYGNSYSVSLWDAVARRDLDGPKIEVGLPDSVDQVEAVAFSPDGKILAIGDRSKQLVLWNISTRKVLARLKGHEEWVSALAFSPDGKTLYSGSMDQTVRLWDFSSYKGGGQLSGEKINVFATIKGHTGWIRSINCSPAGKVMATVGADRTVKLWGEAAGREFDAVEGVAAVSPWANIIATYPDDEDETRMTLFDLRSDEPAQLGTVKGLNPTLSPDGKILATASYDGSTVKLWDVSARRELITLRAQFTGPPPAFSPDGRLFTALGSDGKSVILWGAAERQELAPVRNDAALKDYLLSPDGKVIVTVDKDGQRVKSWDVASRRQLAMFERKTKRDAGAGRVEAEEQATLLALSPDGKFLAFSDSKEVGLWQTDSTQEPILLGRHEVGVSVLAFSPDGKLAAAGDEAGGVKVWDTTTRGELSTFKGHKDAVTALAFSPDGRALASSGSGTVKLYGMASMRELITLTHEPSPTSEVHAVQGYEDTVLEIFFSADGRSLITLSGNHIVRIWRGANDASVAAVRQ